ncbi:MAG TPA: flagellar biosynthetic protein FliQ [Clostridia bacterium]|nr:flagellar biosynthetic protein FliQ [Clostridia bacterium]
MPMETVVELGRTTLKAALLICAPVLAIATIVSLLINIVQVLTSVQETTVATVPRLLAAALAIFLLLPWMLRRLAMFTTDVFGDFHRYLG